MTAICACVINNRYPVLIGDLLLSGPERETQDTPIPTIEKASNVFPKGSGWTIVGMTQKIVIIQGYIALAWSDTHIEARTMINEIMGKAEKVRFTQSSLITYIDELEKSVNPQNLSIVGYIVDSTYGLSLIGYKSEDLLTSELGHIKYGGSGGSYLLNTLHRHTSIIPRMLNGDISSFPFQVITVCAELLDAELMTQKTLLEFYGGGWEICALKNGKFIKLNNITYVFWDVVKESGSTQIHYPRKLFKYAYQDDLLMIRAVKVDPESGRAIEASQVLHFAGPLERCSTLKDVRNQSQLAMTSHYMCNIFRIHEPRRLRKGQSLAVMHIDIGNYENRLLRFDESDDEFFDLLISKSKVGELITRLSGLPHD